MTHEKRTDSWHFLLRGGSTSGGNCELAGKLQDSLLGSGEVLRGGGQ
jgi:hypothetical protein